MGLFVEFRRTGEFPVDIRKLVSDSRAEVRQRAARVNKGDKHFHAAKLIEMNGASVLVAQFEVRNRISRSRNMVRNLGTVIRFALGDNHDMVQPYLGVGPLRYLKRSEEHTSE